MDISGVIHISAENEIEGYALRKFSEDNFGTNEKLENLQKSIVIYHGKVSEVAIISNIPENDDLPF